ncbi:Di-sulfide bridge nucleocytoplasmic transport domain-containing protein [Lipomyces kononenkoae]|uniref:Di-sulfide bridge nucleocytoplasmic transport domain-containing protein n=1 Tax=Lipomyces kononenkoae TaxID=34357 RepID=A0ACC3T373_LIPKO
MIDTMDFSPADRTALLRGHEAPMDFTYHSAGPAMDATSPFREATIMAAAAASGSKMPGAYSQRIEGQTPFFTPKTPCVGQVPFPASRAHQSATTSPLYGRGISMKPSTQFQTNAIDEDVVMLSSPPSPLPPRKSGAENTDPSGSIDASDGEAVTENVGSKFLKAFRSNSASNSSSPLAKAKQLLSLPTRKMNSTPKSTRKKVKYHNEFDEYLMDDGGDDSDATSDWSGRIVVKKTTVLRSPRKVSSSRTAPSPRKPSRTLVESDSRNASLLAFLSRHDNLPFVFASYLQLIFNVFLVLVMLYLIMSFVLMIRHDISRKIEEYTNEAAVKIAQCTKDYLVNGCMPESRVPAIEEVCTMWQNCMNRDASDIGRARVSAQTVAEIVNSFIEPVSYKTMMFVLVLLFGSLYVANSKVTPSSAAASQPRQMPERYAGALSPPRPGEKIA